MLFHLAEPLMVLREDLETRERASRWSAHNPHPWRTVVLWWGAWQIAFQGEKDHYAFTMEEKCKTPYVQIQGWDYKCCTRITVACDVAGISSDEAHTHVFMDGFCVCETFVPHAFHVCQPLTVRDTEDVTAAKRFPPAAPPLCPPDL